LPRERIGSNQPASVGDKNVFSAKSLWRLELKRLRRDVPAEVRAVGKDFLHGEAGRNLDDFQIIARAVTRAA
ncbi:MAG TPA: hypothetical protein VF430_04895, partial [Verrucomicrobiae bacterium]